MTTRRRHHRRPRRRHRRSCLRAVPRRRITIVPASVLFPPPRHRRRWCRSGGGCAPCGGGVATALARCEGWRWRRTRAWRWVGSGGHGLGRSPAAVGGVAVALRRLLRAVRGGGGGKLVRGDGLEAAATGCVLESGGGGSHGDLGLWHKNKKNKRKCIFKGPKPSSGGRCGGQGTGRGGVEDCMPAMLSLE
ncbi:hypothetical protein EDB85DRAFT_1972222 [Lactarius pseudohatsudake]|nr:hypothetical protein EDB85DRAFT_1972222 [Lactarius pseudohatsudake]